jgi:hypothetical protein
MKTLKGEIKQMSKEQTFLKDQRKSVYNKSERVMEPWKASYKHNSNREDLRLMYAAYGIMRGRTFSQIENTHPEESHPLRAFQRDIDKLIEQYEQEVVHISE